MPKIEASSRKKKDEQHFPADPRFGITLSVLDEDMTALCEREEWLSAGLLDFLIQQASPLPQVLNDFIIGSLCVETFLRQPLKRFAQQ
jgi:hypothetical protein